jgi:hypothetical protein
VFKDRPVKAFLTFFLIFAGLFCAFMGGGFVLMYIWEAIINRYGEPDQSLLFWYLPLLFLALFSFGGGVLMLVAGIKRIRK